MMLQSFNSRTREGCDCLRDFVCLDIFKVSIHAPGRGATELMQGDMYNPGRFNSRTREGCD